jgi:hypothetical protein
MTRRLTRLRKTLKEQGTELIIALTPSKADYWPEYIPDRYHQEKSLTNYELWPGLFRRTAYQQSIITGVYGAKRAGSL